MQTEERSTLPFPQSTGRRKSPSTQPKTEMDQRYHNSVTFNTVLYLHFFFCACACESTKVSLHCSTDSKWTSVSLNLSHSFGTCSALAYFNMVPEKMLTNTINQKNLQLGTVSTCLQEYLFSNYLPYTDVVCTQIK